MTNEVFVRARDIRNEIEKLSTLRHMASVSYKRFNLVAKKTLWMSGYNKEVVVCDEGLTKLIEEYCTKRIEELKEELNKL